MREVDRSVLDTLWKTTELAQCRTLDAIHLATAFLFQQQLDEPLRICSLDKRMREQALKLKFKVAPE
ncbi:MAG: hypothetical protein HY360_23430 [Verrucomicrobia bacterium]|nr:hypothetical protein [Verrucomicrobiota bacterium]